MVISHFLKWVHTARVAERAAAAMRWRAPMSIADLPFEDRCAAEAALTLLLDDPSSKVRLAHRRSAVDEPSRAGADRQRAGLRPAGSRRRSCWRARRCSREADLIDRVASASRRPRRSSPARPVVSMSLAAAIAEIGEAEACAALLANRRAELLR